MQQTAVLSVHKAPMRLESYQFAISSLQGSCPVLTISSSHHTCITQPQTNSIITSHDCKMKPVRTLPTEPVAHPKLQACARKVREQHPQSLQGCAVAGLLPLAAPAVAAKEFHFVAGTQSPQQRRLTGEPLHSSLQSAPTQLQRSNECFQLHTCFATA